MENQLGGIGGCPCIDGRQCHAPKFALLIVMVQWGFPSGRLATALLVAASVPPMHHCTPARSADIETFTTASNATIAPDMMVVRLSGEITPGTAQALAQALSRRTETIDRLLIDLESSGGDLQETERLVALLREVRQGAAIDTLVRQGAMCASACIAIFAQGERRSAGGASIWVFHGARFPGSGVPSIALTCRYLDLLREAGVNEAFLRLLVRQGYVVKPGALWVSGYELFHAYNAGLITRLLEPWVPETEGPTGLRPNVSP